MAGSDEEDSVMDLLRPFLRDEVDLLHVAKTLASDKITVDVLLLLSESDLEGLIKKVFPAASVAQEYGLKAAINSRKENPTHGSASGSLDGAYGKLMKRVAELVDDALAKKKSKKSWAISSVKSTEWNTLERDFGLTQICKHFQHTPKHKSNLPPFCWDDMLERSQAVRYLPHLKKIRISQQLKMIDAANKYPDLLSGELGDHTIWGTTGVAVIYRGGRIDPAVSLRCVFELKKNEVGQGMCQILVSLVMANIWSTDSQPFAILTDLMDEWILYWMDGSSIYFFHFESRAVAVGTVEDFLGDHDIKASVGLPLLAPGEEESLVSRFLMRQKYVVPGTKNMDVGLPLLATGEEGSLVSQFSRRQKYVAPGTENMDNLVGLIPEDEIISARADAGRRHVQQMLQRPEFGEGEGYPEGWYT